MLLYTCTVRVLFCAKCQDFVVDNLQRRDLVIFTEYSAL